jgi:hypothetical protein
VFDVHPPHSSIHGWRDFSIQLITITVGLLIALGLEGSVEWLHHRHLMHQAEAALLMEIKSNSSGMADRHKALVEQQSFLIADIAVLSKIIAHPETPVHDHMTIRFNIVGFENVSWTTAQTTGALAYMPYDLARQYSDIYSTQAEIELQVRQTLRDMTISLGPFVSLKDGDPGPNAEEAKLIKRNIETLQGQLYLLGELDQTMDDMYKKFLASNRRESGK